MRVGRAMPLVKLVASGGKDLFNPRSDEADSVGLARRLGAKRYACSIGYGGG